MGEMGGLDELARKQFGLISRGQAIDMGLSSDWIKYRVERGDWVKYRRGVFRFQGTSESWSQYAMGSLLQAGPGSALSHQTAAFLFGLDGFKKKSPRVIDLTTTSERDWKDKNVRLHETRDEVVPTEVVRGLTVTSLARTVVDLSNVLGTEALELALDSAWRQRSLFAKELEAYLATLSKRRPHLPLVKELLASRTSPLDSPKEVELLNELLKRGFPMPVAGYSVFVNGRFGMKVDLAYVEKLIALHFDSYRWHAHRAQFEKDAKQRTLLSGAGWQHIIVTSKSLPGREWSDALEKLLAR